jgi:hypothetical protein
MTPTFLEHIYEPFLPIADSRVADEQGMGLGLGIAKALVAAMRGSMDIQSQVDVGTIVTVHMSSKNARVQTEAFIVNDTESTVGHEVKLSIPAYTEFSNKRVLLYGNDDCAEIISNMSVNCDRVGWSDDIVEWFGKSRLDHYQIIIVDVTSTDKNEWNIAKDIHEMDRDDAVDAPVVALVDYDEFIKTHDMTLSKEELSAELEKRGFCETLFAPFDMSEIIRAIGWWIKS